MDLSTVVSTFASGSNIMNGSSAISSATSSLTGLSSKISGIGTALTNISNMTTASTSALQNLPVALPAMKAVYMLEKKLEMMNGGLSGTDNGSSNFAAYASSITGVSGHVTSMQSTITSQLSSMSSAVSSIPGVTGSTPAAIMASFATIMPNPSDPGYSTFTTTYATQLAAVNSSASTLSTTASSHATNIGTLASAATSSYNAGVTNLKGLAWAQFCSSPQPVAIRSIITAGVDTSTIPDTSVIAEPQQRVAAWVAPQTISPPVGAQTPVPVVNTVNPSTAQINEQVQPGSSYQPTSCTTDQIAAITAQIIAEVNVADTHATNAQTALDSFKAWQVANNYQAIKNNAPNGPTEQAAYDALKAQALTNSDFLTNQNEVKLNKAAIAEVNRLKNIKTYMTTTGPWPGNANGPW